MILNVDCICGFTECQAGLIFFKKNIFINAMSKTESNEVFNSHKMGTFDN